MTTFKTTEQLVKLLFLFTLLLQAACSHQNDSESIQQNKNREQTPTEIQSKSEPSAFNWSFMNNAGGRYPYEIKLFEREDFLERLKNILGDDYDIFVDWWDVEVPIKEVRPGVYWAEACKAHECGFVDFALYINTGEDYIIAGLNSDNGVEVYSEKPNKVLPKTMHDWKSARE